MNFIPYLFNHVYIFIRCIDFSSWLGLACIVLFLILTVHSYVAPTLNKFILFIYFIGDGTAHFWKRFIKRRENHQRIAVFFFYP